MEAAKKIMIIDDEMDLCLLMKNYLAQRHFQVKYSLTLKEGMAQLGEFKPDIIFLDNNLPDGIGWDKAGEIMASYPGIMLYLMSGYQPNIPTNILPDRYKVIQKPISFTDLDFLHAERS